MAHATIPDCQLFFNRHLSWLQFNRRVLEEARDPGNPLLERVKFLAITASNLDEFVEVRLAGLLQQAEQGQRRAGADGRTREQVLTAAFYGNPRFREGSVRLLARGTRSRARGRIDSRARRRRTDAPKREGRLNDFYLEASRTAAHARDGRSRASFPRVLEQSALPRVSAPAQRPARRSTWAW